MNKGIYKISLELLFDLFFKAKASISFDFFEKSIKYKKIFHSAKNETIKKTN